MTATRSFRDNRPTIRPLISAPRCSKTLTCSWWSSLIFRRASNGSQGWILQQVNTGPALLFPTIASGPDALSGASRPL